MYRLTFKLKSKIEFVRIEKIPSDSDQSYAKQGVCLHVEYKY